MMPLAFATALVIGESLAKDNLRLDSNDGMAAPGGMAGAVELACGQRVQPVLSRKQPALWPRQLPPGPQQIEQMRGQHNIAILAAFALLDPDHHALTVDVGYLQRHDFRST